MEPARWQQVETVLQQVLGLTPEERSVFLGEWCASDSDLRREVESLLLHDDADDADEARFGGAPGAAIRRFYGTPHLAAGDEIGRYRVQRVLGSGGMGVVYLAEQQTPRRPVALKVIAPGRSSAEAARRFELESEALGKLDHPAVARIFEAGTAELSGSCVPFIAMEYVDGVSLRDYVVSDAPPLRQRVALAATIAEALQHAHANGVIHRDLKPQNILVDAQGNPHVLDFGLARLLDRPVEGVTQTGQVVGTVAYMSPEQCRGDVRRVDSRTDVYSLGVVFYELFAGALPFASRDTPVAETLRRIEDAEPVALGRVSPACRGDLEVIVEHALQKDPARRYATAAELAADLRRYLANEPVSVRAASSMYRLARWSRRHRAAVVAGSTLLLSSVVVAWVVLSTQIERLRLQDASVRFLSSLLSPDSSWQRDMTYADVLLRVSSQIDSLPAADDRVRASLHERVGVAFWALARHSEALSHLERAYELNEGLFDTMNVSRLRVANILGDVLTDAGSFGAAQSLAREWLELTRRSLGEDHEQTIRFATNLADSLAASGQFEEAAHRYRYVAAQVRRILDESHPDRAEVINSLARLLLREEAWFEAETLAREAIALQLASQGATNPGTLRARVTLGMVLIGQGRLEESAANLEEASMVFEQRLGRRTLGSLDARSQLVRLRLAQGRAAEAETLAREVQVDAEHMFADDSWRRPMFAYAYLTQPTARPAPAVWIPTQGVAQPTLARTEENER